MVFWDGVLYRNASYSDKRMWSMKRLVGFAISNLLLALAKKMLNYAAMTGHNVPSPD